LLHFHGINYNHLQGGSISYAEAQWDEVNTAIANFVENVSDPKACLCVTGDYVGGVVRDAVEKLWVKKWLINYIPGCANKHAVL